MSAHRRLDRRLFFAVGVWCLAACGGGAHPTDTGTTSCDVATDCSASGDAFDQLSMPTDVVDVAQDDGSSADANPCPAYQALCNGMCIPVSVDPNNCGGCGVTCDASQVCSGGACSSGCLPGLTACARSCVDTRSDNANCGACGTACPSGMGCVAGNCVSAVALNPSGVDCTGGGPPIELGGFDGGTRCAGDVAAVSFRWALCSCTNIQLSSQLHTDGFDSSRGPYMPGGLGGGVGANGMFGVSSPSDIGGTLWTASTTGVTASGAIDAHQELHVNGDVGTSATMMVGNDAFVNGSIGSPSAITIGGDLHVPASATVSSSVSYAHLDRGPVAVPPPCDCDPSEIIPIGAIVADASTNNDDARIGLDPTVLEAPRGAVRIDLPCGRYYFTRIQGSNPVTIVAHGHTGVFIGGDIGTSASVTITLDPTAELDVFIAGRLATSSALTIGSPNYPALSRIYIGSTNGFGISSMARLAANFYVPNGPVQASGALEAYGAIFAGDFGASGAVSIHYDRLVLRAGDECRPPPYASDAGTDAAPPDAAPTGCTSCRDCANQACVGGTCGACQTSADCCAPLFCSGGVCIAAPG